MTAKTETELTDTVGCFYEGTPVPLGTIATAMEMTVGELLKLVRAGEGREVGYRLIRRSIGPGGALLHGPASMAFVPSWVE